MDLHVWCVVWPHLLIWRSLINYKDGPDFVPTLAFYDGHIQDEIQTSVNLCALCEFVGVSAYRCVCVCMCVCVFLRDTVWLNVRACAHRCTSACYNSVYALERRLTMVEWIMDELAVLCISGYGQMRNGGRGGRKSRGSHRGICFNRLTRSCSTICVNRVVFRRQTSPPPIRDLDSWHVAKATLRPSDWRSIWRHVH